MSWGCGGGSGGGAIGADPVQFEISQSHKTFGLIHKKLTQIKANAVTKFPREKIDS